MSDHAVEDLVEDSIRAVLASDLAAPEQRLLIGQLYGFQNRFDTSDTFGRLAAELQALGYDGAADAPPGPALPLVARLMALAEARGDTLLAYQWLAMLQRGLDEGDLRGDLPPDYATLLRDDAALAIRGIALRLQLDRQKSRHGGLALLGWQTLRPFAPPADPAAAELYAMLRWFSDLKTTPEKIEAERQKLLGVVARGDDSPFLRLPELTDLLPPGLRLIRPTGGRINLGFLFDLDAPDGSDGGRVLFHIEAVGDLGLLSASFWVISGQLARWQGLDPAAAGMPVHFKYNFFLKQPDDHIAQSRWIHPMGGWKYRLSQSEKALRCAVQDMFLYWDRAAPLRRHHRQALGKTVLSRGVDTVLAGAVRRGNHSGFFRTDIEVMFACACYAIEQGDDPGPAIAHIAARLETLHPRNPLLPVWRQGHAELAGGRIWFPPALSMIFDDEHL